MKKEKILLAGLALFSLAGLVAAGGGLNIPPDQPICRLYGIIQILATIGGVLVAAYAGFQLATSHELTERNNAKNLLSYVVLGLIIIWLAPLLVKNLVGASDVCGW